MTEVQIAEIVARIAHAGQTTKSEGEAFIMHPAAVAARVSDELKAAAWLHDVLEDSAVDAAGLLAVGISPRTVAIVEIVSRDDKESYEAFIERIIGSNNVEAMRVKLADLEHNLRPSCPATLRPRYEKAAVQLRQLLPPTDALRTAAIEVDRVVAASSAPTDWFPALAALHEVLLPPTDADPGKG